MVRDHTVIIEGVSMSIATFNVIFKGPHSDGTTSQNPAVAAGVIALDSMLTSAAKALYGNLVDPEVDVRRTETEGVFEIDFGFRVNMGMARRAELSGDARVANPDPMEVMIALGLKAQDLADPSPAAMPEGYKTGLIPLLQAVNDREIERIYILGDAVDVVVRGDMFHISRNAYRLMRHIGVRKGLAAIGATLTDEGTTEIDFTDRAGDQILTTLRVHDVLALQMNPLKEVTLTDEVRTMALELASPVYRTDECWILTDGLQTFRAKMADRQFMEVIDNGVFNLHSGDVLIVTMHAVTVERDGEGLVSQYTIRTVIDHRKPSRHLLMPGT